VTGDVELLTVAEAAAVLRMSKSAANRAIAAGTFPVPVFRPSPRKVLVSRAMLDRYLSTGVPIQVAS
jgi:excisionase family DNA binding protein